MGTEKRKRTPKRKIWRRQRLHDRVTSTGWDGVKLVGHWFPQQNAARIVLAMHGWRSSWTADFGAIAPFFQKSGCSILFAEQRGHGESEGEHIGFGMLERHDVLEWVRWLRETCGEAQPVYLAGVSMGAATVLMAAGLELPENVHGILADCGFLSAQDAWKHVSEQNLHVRYGGIRRALASRQCRKRIGMAADDYTTLDAMAQCRVPVLFIHGTEDRFVPVQATLENYRACAAPKRLLLVPGAGHAVSYHKDQKRYEDAVLDFWRMFDQTPLYDA